MTPFTAELIGTALLVTLGDGVVANVVLSGTKGHNSGWIVIATGWGLAVAVAVYAVGWVSTGHLNPAVTLAMAAIGKFPWADVPTYIAAQLLGGFLGGVIVYLAYMTHWVGTSDPASKRAVFCTSPAIYHPSTNLLTEIIGTFVLVVGVLAILSPKNLNPDTGFPAGIGPMLVGLLVLSIGLSLGGPTGYAINPARDLGPRLAHLVLPIPGKGDSGWNYAWVPILGPVIGGVFGAFVYRLFWGS